MKWTVFCSGLVGLALLLVPQQGQALSFTVDSATVGVGDVFSINVNVVDAIDLTEWQFNLTYDSTLLQANAVTEGPFLSSSGTANTLFISGFIFPPGEISGVAGFFSDIPPGPSGSGVLASIEFEALSPGLSSLTPSNVFLNFNTSGFTVTPGSVCVTGSSTCGVTPVPEPSSLLLLSLGLGVFLFTQRRQIFGKRGG